MAIQEIELLVEQWDNRIKIGEELKAEYSRRGEGIGLTRLIVKVGVMQSMTVELKRAIRSGAELKQNIRAKPQSW